MVNGGGVAASGGKRGEQRRSFPLAFSRRKSWLAVVSRIVAAKGKSPGRGEEATSITLEKRKRRSVEKEPAQQGERSRRRRRRGRGKGRSRVGEGKEQKDR